MKNLGLLLISAMAVGCATQKYGYRPAGNVTTAEAGYPASHYSVPPGSPRGEVYVTSFGTREIEAAAGGREHLVHLRLAVANHNADTDWIVDPGKQMLVSPGGSPQRPDFMEVDGKHDVNVTVTRGQKKVFDLYYRMPAGARDATQLAGFELQWNLDGGGQTFAQRTAFNREPYREQHETSRTRVAVVAAPWWAYGYGPGWWGGFGFGYHGAWGYPYYGHGAHMGMGLGHRGYYGGGHRSYYGGGGGGGPRMGGGGWGGGSGFRGGGGMGVRGGVTRGGRP